MMVLRRGLVTAALSLMALWGCIDTPDIATESDSGESSLVSQPSQTAGYVQLATGNKEYRDGDPWPFRITAGGLAAMVVIMGYTIRHLGKSRPDNGH